MANQLSPIWLPYTQMQTAQSPLMIASNQGSRLYLQDGRCLIDAVASWWTACHGYQHPHIMQALHEQAQVMSHVMLGGLIHPQAETLAHRLTEHLPTGFGHVFYSESGSVAVEIAMKMALQYWINLKEPQRKHFLCFENGYHGDTLYAMSVCCSKEGMHRIFQPTLPKQHHVKLPNDEGSFHAFQQWFAQHHATLAALIIEPLVQGAGGMKMQDHHWLNAICALCHEYHVLVILDEIFTGFGRTGDFFAFQKADTPFDIICLSKALTGGVIPLAATITNTKVYQPFLSDHEENALMHGGTFMGNPLACAAANASLDLFEREPRLAQVKNIESTLQQQLAPLSALKGVKHVRVLGAIGVVQLDHELSPHETVWFKQKFIEEGVFCRPFRDIVYTTPAFTITEEELLIITQAITKLITLWSSEHFEY